MVQKIDQEQKPSLSTVLAWSTVFIIIYISGAGRHHTVMFYAAPNFTNVSSILHISVFRLFCVHVCNTRLSRATADNAWLSKQLENESSRPRPFEADDRGKHAYPDSGLQAYPRQ